MSLLEHPDAQAIPADAVLTPEVVSGDTLGRFLQRYMPRNRRAEQRHNSALVIRGLQRKTCEPIAVESWRSPKADPVARRGRQVGRRIGYRRAP